LNNEEELQQTQSDDEGEGTAAAAAAGAAAENHPSSPVAAKKKPFNPFGKKDKEAVLSPPRKRKSAFDLLGAVQASPSKSGAGPSPSPSKRLLSHDSKFSVAARKAVSKQRGVL
jgi:hypothetical protein